MKQKTIHISCLVLLTLLCKSVYADNEEDDHSNAHGISFFHARSIGSNKARESAGLGNLITWGYDDCSHGVFWATGAYASSFKQRGLGQYLFFNGCSTMITGTTGGPGVSIFGENFLVNDNFSGAITARPKISYGLIDLNLFCGFDLICNGLYLLAHVPYVQTTWSVDFKETVSTSGTIISAHSLGNPTDTPAPYDSMIDAWNGQETFFDVKEPLLYGRVCGKQTKSLLGDIELALGYIIINDECNYFSVNLRGIIPTGNAPEGEFLFEPIVGNGHYGEVGAGILANFYLWEGCSDDYLTIFINANIYAMLGSRQHRTFDLTANGIGSRYLLFKKFINNSYAGEIVRGPNILTLPISAKNATHGDCVLMLEYIRCGFIIDGGYNLWGRTRDHIDLKGTIPANTYGIAGLTGTAANANLTASKTEINGTNATVFDTSPVYISNADINIFSAAHPGCFSHGFFAHLQYIWDKRYVKPFLGIGTEVEFSGTNKSLLLWQLWAKTGISF